MVWTGGVLLLTSLVRFGWESRPMPPIFPPEPVPSTLLAETRAAVADESRRRTPLAPGETIDPNTASAVELARLSGVGPALAERIVAFREVEGGFPSVSSLEAVPGIGAATVERLRPYLELSAPAPGRVSGLVGPSAAGSQRGPSGRVDLNRASAVDLERLPGIGPALAERIVEHRTTSGRFRSLEDMLAVSGIGPATLERLRPHLEPIP